MRIKIAAALVLLSCSGAVAQQVRVPGIQDGSTIAVTDTFQQVQVASDLRLNCTLQNNGTHTMYVFFGTTANATKAKSWQLSSGAAISTNNNQITISAGIQVTGTNGDAYTYGCQ